MHRWGVWFVVAILVSACSAPQPKEPVNVEEMDTVSLCRHAAENPSKEALSELEKRDYLGKEGMKAVREQKVVVGMSLMALNCVKGNPEDINRTVTRSGMTQQRIYRRCDRCDREYVYLENGVVTGYQD